MADKKAIGSFLLSAVAINALADGEHPTEGCLAIATATATPAPETTLPTTSTPLATWLSASVYPDVSSSAEKAVSVVGTGGISATYGFGAPTAKDWR
jgi:hypothetical protein